MIPVKFSSSGSLIKGYFFPSNTKPAIATILFLQGFPGVEGDELICERLAQAGLNVLTFNYRGTFQSEGHFWFSNVVDDIGVARRFLEEAPNLERYQIDPQKIVLGGWSFGAAMTPAGAAQNPEIKRFFMISGRNFGKEARKIAGDPEYAKQVAKNLEALRRPDGPLDFRDELIPDLISMQDTLDYEKLAPSFKDRDILLIAGWDDDLVPIEEHTIPFYRLLLENETAKARIEAVQDGHEFSKSKDQIVKLILNWVQTG